MSQDTTPSTQDQWQFWVDRGGTFTDIVALRPDGYLLTHKLLSENPQHYADAAIEGIRQLQATHSQFSAQIANVKMGTTVATNALLERKGDEVVLLISKGLSDQLAIGYQTRPDIFATHIQRSQPLYCHQYEVAERVLADGSVDLALDIETTLVQLEEAYTLGFRSVAVVLMHSYQYPQHELVVADIARHVGFSQISLSHQISPLIKLVPRGDTTVADAYLSPVLQRYVEQVNRALPPTNLQFMQSNGGLAQASDFSGKDAILSGPAGGVVGMVRSAEADGFNRIVGFDMGGTSTDVSHYAGELERQTETQIGGVRLRVSMMNIHTVAAGGGSIVRFADGRLQVGPESAGAFPGPACYRNGGPLTITDCNVFLGKIQPSYFPHVFGPEQNQPLDRDTVVKELTVLAEEVSATTGRHYTAAQLAEGFIAIAVDSMAAAVKKISVQRGYDIQSYVLSAFGGAGGQHACLVAEALGMSRVYLHPLAGVLSAYGIGLADQRWLGEQAVAFDLTDKGAFEQEFQTLFQQSPLASNAAVEQQRRVYLRYQGSDTPLLVTFDSAELMSASFLQQHRQLFGFIKENTAIIADAIQLECQVAGVTLESSVTAKNTAIKSKPIINHFADILVGGELARVPIVATSDLPNGYEASGPMLLTDANSTIMVEQGWQLRVLNSGALLIEKNEEITRVNDVDRSATIQRDPVRLEIFNNLFMSVAEQMGFVLEKTASSVNIKERLDFSCALFDRHGELVANAPHIPVHLGSMSESIKVVIDGHPNMQKGDAFVLNTPYNGGTHLPDVTVVKPVFIGTNNAADFYVAARGHHADIGGITPGSMPAYSRHIEEEGVILDNLVLMRAGHFQTDEILAVLNSAKYPARNPQQNIADLMAQLAACEKGASELQRLCNDYGSATVHAYMQYVQDNADETLRACLASLPSGRFSYAMDDDTQFMVNIDVNQRARTACIDFTGTGYRPEQLMHPGNFNAPTSVVRAAVLYSFRLLVAKPIPLNAGFFRALDIIVPEQSIIAPVYPAAVVSGNVETAQYLVDCLMGALGIMAGSQGTNNNFTFGDATHQYYETLCGGAGASAQGVGASAVHSHMTNSRLTDPEVLEQRFPVVLDHFHIRRGSGGTGVFAGGDGVERHIRFLQPMRANIISGHRHVPTFGLSGGGTGATGQNFVLRQPKSSAPTIEWLDSCADVEMNPGDVFCIHTPGGGGFGEKA
ncbi:5-oxoprolinase [hydrothermal vent metagenome]|uniref:5-oxoprolinase n=1 Tax=hydrothermal vent metagenome TaxID=652676 RepID=A0A170PKW7_9ZZZZ